MTLKPEPVGPIPENTARVAHAAFPKGNTVMRLRDEFGSIYCDADFQALFPVRGQPGLSPWRLAMVTVLQFMEHLSDRQAAEHVRARIDWKYALGLDLTDPGFRFSVLTEFRARLIAGHVETMLLDKLLTAFGERGLVKARGRQRTDSTYVLAAIRVLNRLEHLGETLRAALNDVAREAPEWLRTVAEPDWYVHYGSRIEEHAFPKGKAVREALAVRIGRDGFTLLDALDSERTLATLWDAPSVRALRLLWSQQFDRTDGQVQLRSAPELPPAGERFDSPYDVEAHFASKQETRWVGYKVHLTECCGPESPGVITHVTTTAAAVHDHRALPEIHAALKIKSLLPAQHLVDMGYVDARVLAESRSLYDIDLIGPARPSGSWRETTQGAYTAQQFRIDWENKQAFCPQGNSTYTWLEQQNKSGEPEFLAIFRDRECRACPARSSCTKARVGPRKLTLQTREWQQALEYTRDRQRTPEWKAIYKARAGVEGAISQGVRCFGVRQARYRGQAKVSLQEVASAAGMNVVRVARWLAGTPTARTRTSAFAALRPLT